MTDTTLADSIVADRTSPSAMRDVLIAARAQIADPERWTRKTVARRADGASCAAQNPNAVRWCADGALFVVTGHLLSRTLVANEVYGEASAALRAASRRRYPQYGSYSAVNDEEGHAAILAVFDDAIAAAEGEATP